MPKCKNCNTYARYGLEGDKPIYCNLHKTAYMVNLISKRCEHEDCELINPSFNYKGGKGTYCKKHKLDGMIDVRHKTCEHNLCNSLCINYDVIGGKGRFCKKHKLDNMVDVRSPKCIANNCNTIPNYNTPGNKKPLYCVLHKQDNMVDVKNKRCIYNGCKSQASFNYIGVTYGEYCSNHKLENMIDVKNTKCKHIGCDLAASFNVKGKSKEFCSIHKSDIMIDISHKRCKYNNCTSLNPVFDYIGGKGIYCKQHKTHNMINVRIIICELCTTTACYGLPGIKVSRCAKHKLDGMIITPTRKCKEKGCKSIAIYGPLSQAEYCELHKLDNLKNLVERPCIKCNLIMVLDTTNHCEYCNPSIFLKNKMKKQTELMNYLDSNHLEGSSTDKIIDHGVCGMERPDRVFELDDKIIVLECDEHQHRDRECLCEQTRMINIGQSYGGLPVYFIRFNPDNYISVYSTLIESITKRYTLLAKYISDIIDRKITLPNYFISAIYLYFDDWKSLYDAEWVCLLNYE